MNYDMGVIAIAVSMLLMYRSYKLSGSLWWWVSKYRICTIDDLRYTAQLERNIERLEHRLEYAMQIETGTEFDGQEYFEFPHLLETPETIRIPYDIQVDGIEYRYTMIWDYEDWLKYSNDYIYVERRSRRRNKDKYTYLWVTEDEFQSENDTNVGLESTIFDGNYINSCLPCDWEYIGEYDVY